MNGLNRVLLIGNLTRDPVMRATTSGMAICELGLAVNRRYRTASGEEREEACFVDIEVFGKQAEQCRRYLRKGSLTYIEGRLRLDQWEDRATNQKRSRLKVTADRVQFLDSRPREEGAPAAPQAAAAPAAPAAAPAAPQAAAAPAAAPPAPQARPGAYARPQRAQPAPREPAGGQTVAEEPPVEAPADDAVDDIPF